MPCYGSWILTILRLIRLGEIHPRHAGEVPFRVKRRSRYPASSKQLDFLDSGQAPRAFRNDVEGTATAADPS